MLLAVGESVQSLFATAKGKHYFYDCTDAREHSARLASGDGKRQGDKAKVLDEMAYHREVEHSK